MLASRGNIYQENDMTIARISVTVLVAALLSGCGSVQPATTQGGATETAFPGCPVQSNRNIMCPTRDNY